MPAKRQDMFNACHVSGRGCYYKSRKHVLFGSCEEAERLQQTRPRRSEDEARGIAEKLALHTEYCYVDDSLILGLSIRVFGQHSMHRRWLPNGSASCMYM